MKNFAKGLLKVTGVIVGAVCFISLLSSLPPTENDGYDYNDDDDYLDFLYDDCEDELI